MSMEQQLVNAIRDAIAHLELDPKLRAVIIDNVYGTVRPVLHRLRDRRQSQSRRSQ